MSVVTVNKYDIYKAVVGAFVLGVAFAYGYSYSHPRVTTTQSVEVLPTMTTCDVSLTTDELKHIVHRHELADMGISVKIDYKD